MAGTNKRGLALLGSVSALTILSSALLSPAAAQVTVLDAITIIATKTEELAINALAPVSTVREEQIRQLNPGATHQIFFGIPGVATEATAQDPSSAINIRGLQDYGRVAVLVDGTRQNYARLGHEGSGTYFLDPEVIAGVDIVRGPTSNIYGSGAIGGVVAFRTKDVADILAPGQTWGVQTNTTFGTNGFNGVGSIFFANRISPNAEFILGGSFRDQDSYITGNKTRIVNSWQTGETFLAKATFRPADDHQIKISALLYNVDWASGVPAGTPGLTATSVLRDWNSLNLNTNANYKFRPVANPLIDFDANVYWNHTDVTSTSTITPAGATALGIYGPAGTRTNYLINTHGFDVNNTSRFHTGLFKHALTIGGDLFRDDVDNTATAGFGAGYNPRGERFAGGAFAQLRSTYNWLEIISAVRYDVYSLNGVNVTSGAFVSNEADRLSPKITIGITPITGVQPYISYAEGYRAPAVTETLVSGLHPGTSAFSRFLFVPNPSLRPEVGKNSEIGLNLKFDNVFYAGDKFRAKASLFENRVSDFIDTFTNIASGSALCPSAPGVYNTCAQYRNIANAAIQGFEFEAMYDRGIWFAGVAGHVLKGHNTQTGEPISKIPTDMFSLTLGLRSPDQRWSFAARWMAVQAKHAKDAGFFVDPDGPGPAPAAPPVPLTQSYQLVNLYASYQVDPTMLLGLSIENLLNEQYTIYTHEFASPGITAKISLRKSFGGAPDLANLNASLARNYRPAALQ